MVSVPKHVQKMMWAAVHLRKRPVSVEAIGNKHLGKRKKKNQKQKIKTELWKALMKTCSTLISKVDTFSSSLNETSVTCFDQNTTEI